MLLDAQGYSIAALTDAINKPKFVPGRVGALGLFAEQGVASTTVIVEEIDGVLVLVSPSPRGGPGQSVTKTRGTTRSIVIPHFQIDDGVMAEEVQGIRAFGTEDSTDAVETIIAQRLMTHRSSMEVTKEYARVGAIKGVITYADNSTLDIFSFFGVSQVSEIDFDLDAATPAAGVLRKACAGVIRTIATELGGLPFTGVYALCGDTFFDQLLAHTEVRNTFLNNPMASQLRTSYISGGQTYGTFDFGGITWENYRGYVGATGFIDTLKCHIFPTGVPNLFRTYNAPADYIETVNTLGQPMYAKQFPMPNDKGVMLEVQMNTLQLCTRPRALLKGKNT
jgi:hypothetical protein